MKGIVLAGGSGTRLYPLTHCVSKQLMPVYDKPLIYYPISVLMLAGIRDILIISTPRDLPLFKELLKDGSQWGVRFSYIEQPKPEGLAQAFILAEEFLQNDNCCLILGDNIFYGHGLSSLLSNAENEIKKNNGSVIFGYQVQNPSQYGVVELDKNNKIVSIVEKPADPKSNYAITGLYFFDNEVVSFAKQAKPSLRGELEITDVLNQYLQRKNLHLEVLYRGFAWLDTGTHASLLEASHYVHLIEQRQGLKIACLEEIAWRKGFINDEQLIQTAVPYMKSSYGQYVLNLLK